MALARETSAMAGLRSTVKPARTARRGLRLIFGVPLALGILSAVGLVAALVGDGVWDTLSWIALGVPVAVIGFHMLRRG